MVDNSTTIILSKEIWVALITFVAAPLIADVVANLSLRKAVNALKLQMEIFEKRLARVERARRRRAKRSSK